MGRRVEERSQGRMGDERRRPQLTLGRRKLQEKEGRWLKLISGLLIFALGLTMIFKPEWLM